jgi:ribosomal protein S18 acetylase RimI-like enzyme
MNRPIPSLHFKPFASGKRGTVFRLLSTAYKPLFKENRDERAKWREYDEEVMSQSHAAGACGFYTYLGNRLIGFASFDPRGSNGTARIGHNCILPAFHGRGYGVGQLRELLRLLRERGFCTAVATTRVHEFFAPALRMYRCCGFRETERAGIDGASGLRTVKLKCDLSIRARKALKRDFDRVLTLFAQLWPDKKFDRRSQRLVYHAMLDSGGYELLCAERKGRVVGFASMAIQQNFWQKGRTAQVTTLVVDKTARHRGIGTLLVGELYDAARRQECKKIELDSAFHRIEAHAFYEKLGFEKRAYTFSRDVA